MKVKAYLPLENGFLKVRMSGAVTMQSREFSYLLHVMVKPKDGDNIVELAIEEAQRRFKEEFSKSDLRDAFCYQKGTDNLN